MPTLAEAVAVSPPKMQLTRLDDPSLILTAQYNPEELSETGGAEYARQTVPGLSHKVKQFTHTKDRTLKFSLRFLAIDLGESGCQSLVEAREFIITSCYPRKSAGLVASGGAPRMMFVWPNYFALMCVITDWSIKSQMFNTQGQLTDLMMDLTVEEIRDTLLTSDQFFVGVE